MCVRPSPNEKKNVLSSGRPISLQCGARVIGRPHSRSAPHRNKRRAAHHHGRASLAVSVFESIGHTRTHTHKAKQSKATKKIQRKNHWIIKHTHPSKKKEGLSIWLCSCHAQRQKWPVEGQKKKRGKKFVIIWFAAGPFNGVTATTGFDFLFHWRFLPKWNSVKLVPTRRCFYA